MSTIGIAATHLKYSLIETARVPMAIIGALVFPAISLLFFVVPQAAIAEDPRLATHAVIAVSIFAVMAGCLFNVGLDLAERREGAWDPYLRTMPVPGLARVLAHGARVLIIAIAAVLPVLAIGALLTAAEASAAGTVAGLGMLVLTAVPFVLLGTVIGYGLPPKAAIPVIMVAMMSLAFGGGLFLPPQLFPSWLADASAFLPTRQARELVIWAVQGGELAWWAPIGVLAWSGALLLVSVALLRRDAGRRFR
ncbi:ABC transporter permease [Arenivirga flava]|uniref:ABC transporter n=1 Tax=Arenivirga flava TaxID=1930060 RepID=A0AA37UHW0_9MICO|nr:ABC transporter permease [Arenivirga flava]GMA29545.1 hypothetical protein GCM10025874_27980 [Arenivirga flava]